MKLETVVICLYLEERNLLCANLLLWDKAAFHPYSIVSEQTISLTVNLLASAPRQGFEAKVRSIYNSTERVKHCFSELKFIYCDHDVQTSTVNTIPTKSFIHTLESTGRICFLRLDVAAIAIKPNWLALIEEEAITSRFWMKGAKYEGISELEAAIKEAFHETGIYAVDKDFQTFISSVWRPLVEKHAIISPELTAHQVLHKAIRSSPEDYDSGSLDHFRISSAIANHDGSYERQQSEGVALRKLMRDSKIAIGIGKHFYRELETIDISYNAYRKVVRQYFQANKL